MATRLNVDRHTLGQLTRFAIVGFSLAGLYSVIYWYLATFVMAPVLAVAIAFLVAVSIGFVLHSRWSFRGHGQSEDHRLKVKFLARPVCRLPAQRGVHLDPHRAASRTDLVAAGAGDLRHADGDLPAQPAMGFPLMERIVYEQMAQFDQRHWWYRARREVLAALIERTTDLPKRARLLEIGCGTGHNLAMLGRFGRVDALELDEEARGIAEERLGRPVMRAPLPEIDDVPDGSYHLIGAFDVIEHIDDDHAAIASIAAKLRRGGKLIVTVPAHPWMWSPHDVVNHHHRRYSKRALRKLIEGSPLKLEKIGYFNSLLFPVAVAERMVSKLRGNDNAELKMPPAPLNAALEKVFEAERHLIARLPLPPGLSLFAVASAT